MFYIKGKHSYFKELTTSVFSSCSYLVHFPLPCSQILLFFFFCSTFHSLKFMAMLKLCWDCNVQMWANHFIRIYLVAACSSGRAGATDTPCLCLPDLTAHGSSGLVTKSCSGSLWDSFDKIHRLSTSNYCSSSFPLLAFLAMSKHC